jgi:predicted alpha/beta-fold hydrolase
MKITIDSIISNEHLASIKKRLSAILANKHIDTILPIYLTQSLEPKYSRERIDTPDGDFIDLDWVNKNISTEPTVILFHGFEGSSRSQYVKRVMYYLEEIGWRGVVAHYRGCSGELNRLPTFYHAGQTEDIKFIINEIKIRTDKEIYAVGFSLGGNGLLKYLGENPDSGLNAAFAMSVPFDLKTCIDSMDQGFNKYVYVKNFLTTLLPKMKEYTAKVENFKHSNRKIDTLREFNDLYICQFFDFKSSEDYYQRSSCIPFLRYIQTPTMILQSENDPLVPVTTWPHKDQLSPFIRFIPSKTGGHVGFIELSNNLKDSLLKLPKFMIEYFTLFKGSKVDNWEDLPEVINEFVYLSQDEENKRKSA